MLKSINTSIFTLQSPLFHLNGAFRQRTTILTSLTSMYVYASLNRDLRDYAVNGFKGVKDSSSSLGSLPNKSTPFLSLLPRAAPVVLLFALRGEGLTLCRAASGFGGGADAPPPPNRENTLPNKLGPPHSPCYVQPELDGALAD